MVVLHLAFLDGLTFGEDIVFTYGPWGFVATRTYVPGTFGWLIASWIVLVASIWYAAFAVRTRNDAQRALGCALDVDAPAGREPRDSRLRHGGGGPLRRHGGR